MTRAHLLLFGIVIASAGCGDSTSPASVPTRQLAVAPAARRLFGQQRAFLDMADSVPGFAGIFLGPDGRPRLALTSAANTLRAVAAVNRRWPRGVAGWTIAQADRTPAEYSYRQLYDWKEALEGAIGSQALAYGIHVTTNTVDIYSPSGAVDASIAAYMRTANIPSAAVVISRRNPRGSSSLGLLYQQFGPVVPGGAGIWFKNGDGVGEACTLGVNAKFSEDDSAPWMGLTASHCSVTIGGGSDGTAFYQGGFNPTTTPWTFDSTSFLVHFRLGNEVDDPTWNTDGCDSGQFYCRAADVLAISYATGNSGYGPDSGGIAVTDGRNTSSITFGEDSTTRTVVGGWGEQPWEGTSVDHVGITTGWHSGTVTVACMDFQVGQPGYDDHWYDCQTVVDGPASQGDSGGPVFTKVVGKSVMFAGIVSRWVSYPDDTTHYVFSAYPNICTHFQYCPILYTSGE